MSRLTTENLESLISLRFRFSEVGVPLGCNIRGKIVVSNACYSLAEILTHQPYLCIGKPPDYADVRQAATADAAEKGRYGSRSQPAAHDGSSG